MSTYDRLAGLELEVEELELERRQVDVSSEFSRATTTVVLRGGGTEGRGEDVGYDAASHDGYPRPELAGHWTIDSLSAHLDGLDLFAVPPKWSAAVDYRRWAFESAALDLALRQAGLSLGGALGREYRPVRFVISTREDALEWHEVDPSLEFKLDPTSDWTRELMERLAATGCVRTLDFKAYYVGTPVDQPVDPDLYRACLEVFPDVVIEDAAVTAETRPLLEPAADRLSWDAPIHSVADIESLPFEPHWLNVKPSRFGSLRRLLECIDWCGERGVQVYGGGQFELGVGRGQIQALASLFYADTPNDVAPGVYNTERPRPGLPGSPLEPPEQPQGFSFSA